MRHEEFLNLVVEDGIQAARESYSAPRNALKREGAEAGFEACRGLDAEALGRLHESTGREAMRAMQENDPRYWWWRCRHLEVEWTCNVVSAARMNMGLSTIVPPTARGLLKAVELLGEAPAPPGPRGPGG